MSLVLTANIVLGTIVLTAIVGMLMRAIRTSRPPQLRGSVNISKNRRLRAQPPRVGAHAAVQADRW
jgi:hypothetical protein